MKKPSLLPFITFLSLAGLVMLAGCGKAVIEAGSAAGIYFTKPGEKPPADTSETMPPHQTWCYRTLGVPECFDAPQPGAGSRLINVQPGNIRPGNAADYQRMSLERTKNP